MDSRMDQNQTVCRMHRMLGLARQRLTRQRIGLGLLEALSLGSRVVPITLAVTLVAGLLARPRGVLTARQLAFIVSATVLSAVVCLAIRCARAVTCRPSWLDAAQVLDSASNRHNLIATAYDLARQGRTSVFARMAIGQGVEVLQANVNQRVHLAGPPPSLGRTGAGLLVTALLAVAVGLIPRAGGSLVAVPRPLDADLSGMRDASLVTAQARQPHPDAPTEARPSPQTAVASPRALAREAAQSLLQTSLAMAGTSQNEAGLTHQPFSAQSPSVSAAAPQETAPSEGRPETGRPIPPQASPDRVEEEPSPSPVHTQQRAGSSGTPESESKLKASLLSGDADQDSEVENEEDRRDEKPQQRALAGTGGQPLLSDRLAAPSRELGMSGKQSDLPPEGRGGPSDLKKSRATATILSGIPMPVHVKGIKQQGKSKSQARAMPLGAGQVEARPIVEATGPGREGEVQRFAPDEAWRAVLDRYYQGLRESESSPGSE